VCRIWNDRCAKCPFGSILHYKMITLPRQARDKHETLRLVVCLVGGIANSL
jgi:hypothetical protein